MPLLPFICQAFFTTWLPATSCFSSLSRYHGLLRLNHLTQFQFSAAPNLLELFLKQSATMSSRMPTSNRKSLSFLMKRLASSATAKLSSYLSTSPPVHPSEQRLPVLPP